MPKINGNEIRPGYVLEHNDGLWAAVKVDHVKPGKGGAFAQVELRNLRKAPVDTVGLSINAPTNDQPVDKEAEHCRQHEGKAGKR